MSFLQSLGGKELWSEEGMVSVSQANGKGMELDEAPPKENLPGLRRRKLGNHLSIKAMQINCWRRSLEQELRGHLPARQEESSSPRLRSWAL